MKQFKNQFQRKVLFFQIKVPLMLIFQIMLKYILLKNQINTQQKKLCATFISQLVMQNEIFWKIITKSKENICNSI